MKLIRFFWGLVTMSEPTSFYYYKDEMRGKSSSMFPSIIGEKNIMK